MTQEKIGNPKLSPTSTFIRGVEHAEQIGCYIDCSENPYDLRLVADGIMRTANTVLQTMPEGQPLVILMGEPHSMPSRIELQHVIASRLLADGHNFTFNFEYDHHYWSQITQAAIGKEIAPDLYYRPTDYDPAGQGLLATFLGFGGFVGAPVAIANLMAFCQNQRISTIFNCPATDSTGALNLQDSFTKSIVQRHLGVKDVEGLKLDRSNPKDMRTCMAITNLAMAERGINHATMRNARVILQHAGLNHIFGNENEGCDYEDSLTAAYQNSGAVVLPVFATVESDRLGLNILPKASYPMLSHSVVIDGLAEEKFIMGQEVDEKRLITEKLYKSLGSELKFYDVVSEKEKYKALAHAEADQLIQRYELDNL